MLHVDLLSYSMVRMDKEEIITSRSYNLLLFVALHCRLASCIIKCRPFYVRKFEEKDSKMCA